ncbi:hypothetical protein MAA_10192 [Metarhizium robertsii ARSEF 23]|nr:uncharacterized protein MAA_10192 [Metarhizium robertsii ARSEF 23]EFY94348.1 hypothetical protein MAA_10192 [Metarhizium robertsii ARSEF 23]
MNPAHDSGAASWDENHSDEQSQLHGSEHLLDLSNLLYSRHDQSVDGASADDRFDVTWSLASTNAMSSCFPFEGQMDMGPGIPIGSTNIAGGVSDQYIDLDKPILNGIDPFSDPDTALGWSANPAQTIDGRNFNPYFAMTEKNDQEKGSYTPDFGQSLENNAIEETRAVTNFTEDFM